MAKPHGDSLNDIRRLQRAKTIPNPAPATLGGAMIDFYKHSVAKRQTKLEKLADAWGKLIPPTLSDHCSLETFSKGTLAVAVDSSSHLYELKQLLLAGLQQQMLLACRSAGLRKISLKPGRWYEGDQANNRRVRFPDR